MVLPEGASPSAAQADTTKEPEQPQTSTEEDTATKPQAIATPQPNPPKPKPFAFLFKYIFLGDSGVGKSALLQRYCKDCFLETHQYTTGLDYDIKALQLPSGERVKLQLWDTPGDDRFREFTTTFYRGTSGVIVVYDMTDEESFNNISRWVHEAVVYCRGDVVIIVVGNKKDLQPSPRHNESDRVRELLRGDQRTDSAVLGVYEVSTKTGEGVDQAFQDLTDRLVTMKLDERNPLRAGQKGKTASGPGIVRLGQDSEKPKSKCCC